MRIVHRRYNLHPLREVVPIVDANVEADRCAVDVGRQSIGDFGAYVPGVNAGRLTQVG